MNTKYPRQVRIIRNARKAMGYSQQQVATLIGVHIRQYQRIEFGERDIRCASMKLGLAICAVLGIDEHPEEKELLKKCQRTNREDAIPNDELCAAAKASGLTESTSSNTW